MPTTQAPQFSAPPAQRRPVDPLDTPEARAHAEEAKEIQRALSAAGVADESVKVAPTLDRQGHVRLTFAHVRTLLERRSA
jgi:hypothetical protein